MTKTARIEFHDEQGAELADTAEFESAAPVIRGWAERNEYERVVFHSEGDKLWVQLGDDKLNYWMPRHALKNGTSEDIEMQLDYARGAQRRGAVGYDKFDR